MSPANPAQACTANAPATAYPWLVYRAEHGLVLVRRTVRGSRIYLTAGESAEGRGSVILNAAKARQLARALLRMADGLGEGSQ